MNLRIDEKISQDHKDKIKLSANLLKTISNPIRLCLVEKLINEGETNVNSIVECMGLSQPNISQHLKILRDNDIVSSRRVENQIFYSCHRRDIKKIIACLNQEDEL
ncbi:MAG: metalloregulator ArsR/SmtB family transcription factor [Tissierellia bacterium]|nr:metalloregulator ArsR/SmtB family transcription factor [Tissierellia bacterium]